MKKTLFFFSFYLASISSLLAQNSVRKVTIDVTSFQQQLAATKHESVLGIGNAKNSETIITLPMPDGTSAQFRVVEYSILPAGIDSDAKTYLGEQVGNPAVGCRITLTKEKLIAVIQSNGQMIVIEPDAQSTISNTYNVYQQTSEAFECNVNEALLKNGRIKEITGTNDYTNGTSLRTYRMAIIVTNEFYTTRGNTNTAINNELAAIFNSLNGLYEKEMAVRFTLKSPVNPASANVFFRKTENTNSYYQNVDVIRAQMNTIYGVSNYDIGHALHTVGGGLAYYGVCSNDYKGGGWSGSTTPSSFLILAHEVGHQFTAPHTFNGNGSAACNIGNRNTPTAYEPGSGSTIMSYHGLCAITQNLTGPKESYFHTNSLDNMINYIQTGTGSTCGTPTATGNSAPVVNAGTAYTIPKNTPFTLIGSATDANGDALTFTWEEYDQPMASDSGKLGHTNNAVGSTTAPLFRSKHSLSPVRNFPDMAFVLNNSNNPPDTEGEDLPNVGRTMVFRLTARDNRAGGGGVDMHSLTITVDGNKGPLAVTAPNGAESWAAGTAKTISWSVNSTNALSANVNILLSIDGGSSYPFTLAASTTNDGSESVNIPAYIPNSTTARVKIVSTNSATAEFFDVSNANFTITSNCNATTSFICPDNEVSGNSGAPVFNLGLTKTIGSLYFNKSKTISFTGGSIRPVVVYTDENKTACQVHSWNVNSKLVTFRVTKTGSYTISALRNGTSIAPFSIFSALTFNCANLTGSNAYGAVSWSSNAAITLNECTTYYALVYDFYDDSSFSFNFSGSGDIIDVQTEPAGLSYTYLAVNQTSGLISAVSSSSNFTSLPGGTYQVYGVSYATGFDTNTMLNKTMSQAYALGGCILFSNNSKKLTIIASPCPTNLTLTNPANNITSGNVTRLASATNGKITATNHITGGNTKAAYMAKAVELNAGFKAETGVVFTAETGGCN
ncbi:reprolysin-like metallopeptidase [Emticicia agri]|uniref:Peptidase M12B domain-containing protein n=1 Tax=Emticicia agri TaxID=2492393 RepID=A0A4Q5LZ59_9BACT|nr:M12 family metallo-peptidase [Emticicia agri]RYU94823.1 hypothetical protein EWM59_15045 [Emticicia agri]